LTNKATKVRILNKNSAEMESGS